MNRTTRRRPFLTRWPALAAMIGLLLVVTAGQASAKGQGITADKLERAGWTCIDQSGHLPTPCLPDADAVLRFLGLRECGPEPVHVGQLVEGQRQCGLARYRQLLAVAGHEVVDGSIVTSTSGVLFSPCDVGVVLEPAPVAWAPRPRCGG